MGGGHLSDLINVLIAYKILFSRRATSTLNNFSYLTLSGGTNVE